MIRYIEIISLKLLMSVVPLLLLLTMVAYTPPFLHKVFAATDTHIAAAGDWGCSSNTEKTVNNVKSKNPQLLLALGDYSYEKTSTCWLDLIKPVDSITKVNLGNHEDHGLVDSYLSHFGLSNPFYSYNINNVHVLTMATEEKFDTNSEQYNFVVNDLRNAANNPDIKWIIVTMHSPFYSSPNTFKEFDCGGDEACQLYHPLFDKYGVDLVLQGHVHNYERSFPLKFNQATPSNPIVTSTMKTDYENPDGEIFAIVGTGGVNLHGLSDSAPFIASQQDSNFGILDIHLSDNKLDAKFVTNDGVIDDHFSISKTAKKKIIERISDNIVTDTNVKQVSDKGDTKAKPLSEDKPTITYKQSEDNTATDTNAKQLSDNGLTGDKPQSTHNEDKIDLSNNDKSTNDNSHVSGLLGPTDTRDPVDDEESADSHGEMTIKSNVKDPFSSVN